MPRGGTRPGAGRPPSRVKYVSPITAAEVRIADRLPELVDTAFELAFGVIVAKLSKDGKPRVYKTPPDIKALTYLVDRVMGKPKQSIELGGEDGGPIVITYVNDWRAAGPRDEIEFADPAALPAPWSSSGQEDI